MVAPLPGRIGDDGVPLVQRGDWLVDERHGLVEVGGWTTAPIPWPYRKRTGAHSLILCGRLADDVRNQAELWVSRAYGVGVVTVWGWRRALGVGRINEGTRKLLSENTGVPEEAAARGREKARQPESRAKMAATKRGEPAPPSVAAGLYRAACAPKPPGWGAKANAWMLAGKKKKEMPKE